MSVLNTTYETRLDILSTEAGISIEEGSMHYYNGAARLHNGTRISTVGGNPNHIVWVGGLEDLPTPISGVITLADNVTYFLTTDLDLAGNRLVGGSDTTIIGGSSENCTLTSTGLGVGVPLLTIAYTTPIRHISFENVDTAFAVDGTARVVALDWTGVNFVNVPNVGTIDSVDNWIFTKGAFLNSGGLSLTGTIGTVAFNQSLFNSDSGNTLFNLQAGLTITRRFRIIYSSLIVLSGETGISLNASATIPDESLILDTCNFAGGGTYLTGIDAESNKALFIRNVGIENTSANGQLYMQNNAVATTVAVVDTFYKIAGTTTPSDDNSKFSHTNNRLTCTATISRKYLIQANLTFTAGNHNVCEFGLYDSQIPGIRVPSRTKTTANAAGRAENITLFCVTRMKDGDFIEVHGANASLADITVESLNFVITEIN